MLASGNSNRKAERPTNAILNYLYALIEVEAVMACHVVGLDPGLAIIHSDTRGRHSLALDLIQPVRPAVEEFVLKLLEQAEIPAGSSSPRLRRVRLTGLPRAAQSPVQSETLPLWANLVAPIAERLEHDLGKVMTGKYQPATPLTRGRARKAAAVVKARKTAGSCCGIVASSIQQAAWTKRTEPIEPVPIAVVP